MNRADTWRCSRDRERRPHRENEPAYVVKIAELLATLWGVTVERVAEVTTANFERVFSVTLPRA